MSLIQICRLKNFTGISDESLLCIKLECEGLLLNKDKKLTDGEKNTLNQVINSCKAQLEVLRQKRLKG